MLEKFTRKYLYFTPYYNRNATLNSQPPEIFNINGQRINVFFLSDREFAHGPYGNTSTKHILWDRYNFGLRTHFYTHYEAFNLVGNPDRRFAMLTESRAIKPDSYKKFMRHKNYIENEFEAVFTYDYEILNTISNAKFVPFCAEYWYGKIDSAVKLSPENYLHKSKNISILSSYKHKSQLHRIRRNLAIKCRDSGLADSYGTFDGGAYVTPESTLKDYRYSIIIENDITPLFFTEKLTNCFAAQTIPVYLGATEIDEFFNADGIMKFSVNDADNIQAILKACTPDEYMRRLPAILDNYERVRNYKDTIEYMYTHYLREYYG